MKTAPERTTFALLVAAAMLLTACGGGGDSSGGSTLVNRVDATGYLAIAWGENVAGGPATVDAVMAGWLASAGHCANIMNSTFRDFGAACARNDAAAYQRYWTQDFAAPR